jgi:ribosomal protein S1
LLAVQLLQVGDKIRGLVLNMDYSQGCISLSTKKLEKEPGDVLRMSHEAWLEQAEEQGCI